MSVLLPLCASLLTYTSVPVFVSSMGSFLCVLWMGRFKCISHSKTSCALVLGIGVVRQINSVTSCDFVTSYRGFSGISGVSGRWRRMALVIRHFGGVSGDSDFSQWIGEVEQVVRDMVAEILEAFVPLFLSGGAFCA